MLGFAWVFNLPHQTNYSFIHTFYYSIILLFTLLLTRHFFSQ